MMASPKYLQHLCIVSFESLTPSVNKIGPKMNTSSTLPLTYFHSQKKLLTTNLCFLPLNPFLILKKRLYLVIIYFS